MPRPRRPLPSLLLLLLVAAPVLATAPERRYQPVPPLPSPAEEGPWVVRVGYADKGQLDLAAAIAAPWQVDREQHTFVTSADRSVIVRLLGLGVTVDIDLARTATLGKARIPIPGQVNAIPGYPCYRTVEETEATATSLVAAHPTLASYLDVGDSWEKEQAGGVPGYDLHVLRITNAAIPGPKPVLFVMGSIHAREYTPAELLTRFGEWLLGSYGTDADATWLVDYHDIHLMLHANPDGRKHAEQGSYWRKNTDDLYCTGTSERGADLNRNYPYLWGCCGGSSGSQCDETYRGPVAASEPETQSVEAYVRTILPDQWDPPDPSAPIDATGVFMDIHSYSQLVLWPWGYTSTPSPNAASFEAFGRKLAYFNGYYPEPIFDLYITDGTTVDFAYGELGVAAIAFELGTDFFQDCGTFEQEILPDNLAALTYAAKVARTPYLTTSGPDAVGVAASPGAVMQGLPVDVSASADDTRFSTANGSEAMQPIASAELYVDTPPWASGSAIPMQAVDGTFDELVEPVTASLATTGLALGRHILFVRAQDASGTWGPVSATFLDVLDPSNAPRIAGTVRDATTGVPLPATVVAGGTSASTDPFTGYYEMVIPAGTYDVTASAAGHASSTATGVQAVDATTTVQDFDLWPSCPLLDDDVESGNAGWSADAPWAITTEAASSPTHSWTDSPGGPYADDVDASLTSPVLDLSGYVGTEIDFQHTYDLESGFDTGRLEASTDGGTSFTPLASYTGVAAWGGVTVDASVLDGAVEARIRFRIVTDGGVIADGWHVDDILIRAGGPGCPSASVPVDQIVGQGDGAPNPNEVRVYTAAGTATSVDFYPYGAGAWGAHVASGDLATATPHEILTGAGPGPMFGPHVRGFRSDGSPIPRFSFYAYGTLRYGVNGAAGQLDAEPFDEMVSGAGPGVVFGPHVRGWDDSGTGIVPLSRINFFAYGTLRYGVNVATGSVEDDAGDEMLTGPGPGPTFAPTIRGFDYDGSTTTALATLSFDAFAMPGYGAQVAAGDVGADDDDELAATPGPGPAHPARFAGFDHEAGISPLPGFDIIPAGFPVGYGGRLALGDLDLTGRAALVTSAGPGPSASALVLGYTYDGTSLVSRPPAFTPFATAYGVNLATGALGL